MAGRKSTSPAASVGAETDVAVPCAKSAGETFCAYIGPTIVGVIQSNSIFSYAKQDILKDAAVSMAIKQFPSIADLIVSGETLATDRIKVKTPGNALFEAYKRVVRESI